MITLSLKSVSIFLDKISDEEIKKIADKLVYKLGYQRFKDYNKEVISNALDDFNDGSNDVERIFEDLIKEL